MPGPGAMSCLSAAVWDPQPVWTRRRDNLLKATRETQVSDALLRTPSSRAPCIRCLLSHVCQLPFFISSSFLLVSHFTPSVSSQSSTSVLNTVKLQIPQMECNPQLYSLFTSQWKTTFLSALKQYLHHFVVNSYFSCRFLIHFLFI